MSTPCLLCASRLKLTSHKTFGQFTISKRFQSTFFGDEKSGLPYFSAIWKLFADETLVLA